ncbi:MAG: hypothetical protein RLZZ524_3006 [Pseudomonadota bacterium]|jgi:hypothetical protein
MELNFNASGVDITNRFEALPAGDYVVMITESQERATKTGDGSYLELTLEIQSGPMTGRKVWDRLNLHNQSAKAVEIAQRQLAQICHAVGVMAPRKSEELHFKPMVAMVKAKPDERSGEMRNEVKGYKAAGTAAPAVQQAAPSAPRAPVAAAKPAMPWATAKA